MRPELEISQLFDRYLSGDVSLEEKLSLENRLKLDFELFEDFENHKLINEIITGAVEEEIRSNIAKDIINFDSKTQYKKWSLGFLIVALSAGLLLILFNTKSTESLKDAVKTKVIPLKNELKENIVITKNSINEKENKKNSGSKSVLIPLKKDSIIELPKLIPIISDSELKSINLTEPSNTTVIVPEINPCINSDLKINPKITGTCIDRSEGIIDFSALESIKGGIEPYSIRQKGDEAFKSVNNFSWLSSGNYPIEIKDANGCISIFEIKVPVEECSIKNFAINPDLGEIWSIPVKQNLSYTITILKRNGAEITHISAGPNEHTEWNGKSSNGADLETGLYFYIIEYENTTKENGQISIIR